MEIQGTERLVIRLYPDYGHPSSLWPSKELVRISRPRQPYVLPSQIGIDDALGKKILAWTDRFQKFFVEEVDGFASRPRWLPGINVFDWYDEGYEIIEELRAQFPDVQVKPQFAQYVFSANERRESMGLLPISLPNEPKAGYISITDVLHPKGPK
ncbi:hypothetical protein [Rhodococcus sp. ARC_M6]|uniref:hypothetical protein n=1 Tax=Rhodococcus sp. ARC_M6 TaxID=2928852 RepID=UPI001FB3C7E3|nr:hypothetical protein [Rhodococcus sp. ARC_M6]MCJ0906862.1 hypothetical protein [Rhodococcus sp. ARC_M6]